MMTVPMDSSTAAQSPRDIAERLHKKNGELEGQLRRAVQSKVPSDPNIWLQMRENFEKIILIDHDFSEQNEIEYLLWLLHYKRIEEFRRNISSASSVASQGVKNNANAERIRRIKSAFRSFLSEATGFYHDLMLKIRSTYGLPLAYFSEGPENASSPMKDEKKTSKLKKGLISCHRCLIYLGDLARYKGLNGDEDSASREYAAAASYYKEAASIYPSSGNPHHQLAILASYSGNEVVTVYRYFRSLAADAPFSTARDNLIILFEKNRQTYGQLPVNNKVPTNRTLPPRFSGRGRGRGEVRFQPKDVVTETSGRERECSIPDTLKAFYVRFVRLNGILFTRTSLETFEDLFASVSNDFHTLLSCGPEEQFNFGSTAAENALAVVRLVAILIFTVQNVMKEPDSQSYAEIVQRRVLLQSAFAAAFEFVGRILKRCLELHDIPSSFYLPAILVYIEWLASHPELAVDSEMEEMHANARSFFWNQYVTFINKLLLTDLASIDGDDDEACFSNMSTYEGETGNRLALWEDLELRGFSPLVPAQIILDFSNKHTSGNAGSTKEKKARVQRIVAAGKSLLSFVVVDQLRVFFDPSAKKFVIGKLPCDLEANVSPHGSSDALKMNSTQLEQLCPEGDDDEEIVFKPTASEKFPRTPELSVNGYIQPVQMPAASWPTNIGSISIQNTASMSAAGWPTNGGTVSIQNTTSVPLDGNCDISQSLPMSSIGWAVNGEQKVISSIGPGSEFVQSVEIPASRWASNGTLHVGSQNLISTSPGVITGSRASASMLPRFSSPDHLKFLGDQDTHLMSGMKNLNIIGNGYPEQRFQGLQSMGYSPQMFIESGANIANSIHNLMKVTGATIPSALDSVVPSVAQSDGVSMKLTEALPPASKKNPVSRPSKPVGPPPGFNHVTPKRHEDSISVEKLQNPQIDDYSWLDGYHSSANHIHNLRTVHPDVSATSTAFTIPFPFPGKQQASGMQTQGPNEKSWQDFHLFEPAKQTMFQNYQQRNQQNAQITEQEPANPVWFGRYHV